MHTLRFAVRNHQSKENRYNEHKVNIELRRIDKTIYTSIECVLDLSTEQKKKRKKTHYYYLDRECVYIGSINLSDFWTIKKKALENFQHIQSRIKLVYFLFVFLFLFCRFAELLILSIIRTKKSHTDKALTIS